MSAPESPSTLVLDLAEEFLKRYRQGERPSPREYVDRYPHLAAEIKEVFRAVVRMENIVLADESLAENPTVTAPPWRETAEPKQLGDFRILREIGHGGMGIVYEAEQVSLRRRVALKVLPLHMLLEPGLRQRFEREAKAAAQLHHTNIVPVFGVGEYEGQPYYVMQFIRGLGLDDVLKELRRLYQHRPSTAGGEPRPDVPAAEAVRSLMTQRYENTKGTAADSTPLAAASAGDPADAAAHATSGALPISAAVLPGQTAEASKSGRKPTYWQSVAQIGVQVADALDYAHKQGILHRDIKPSNLLLDTHGTVWIADFGLAKTNDRENLTHPGDVLGTLRYMPPEAFEGRADARGDVYALGLTLYELLALRPAFGERDRHKLVKQVATEQPSRLHRLNAAIPADLATIVHKALENDPNHRYQTAASLADDLRRFLADEPIQARQARLWERSLRWMRHRPAAAGLIGVSMVAVVALGFAAISVFYSRRLEEERNKALLARDAEIREHQVAQRALREAEQARDAEFRLRGLLHVRNRQWTEAADSLAQVVLTHPNDFDAWLGLAQARAELGRDGEAVAAFTRALDVKADSVAVLLERGECYLRLDRAAEADADFTAAARLDAAAAANWHKARLDDEPSGKDARRALVYHLRAVIEAKQTPAAELPLFLQRRAALLVEQGREAESLPDLHRLLQLQPSHAPALFLRGVVFSRLGQRDKAAADFIAALELGPDLRDPWSPERAQVDDELTRHEDVFARVAQARPKDRQLWLGRAYAHVRRGQWQRAADAMTRAIELNPSDASSWFFDAPLRLVLGDIAGYQRDCRAMLQRFGQTDGPSQADQTAKTCLLHPAAGSDLKPVLRLAELAVVGTERNVAYPWFLAGRALADYRTGEFARALERLRNVHPLPGDAGLEATVLALLALTHHGLKHPTEARAALAKARALEAEKFPRIDRGQRFGREWHNWLRYRVLRREAEEAIEGGNAEPKK